MSNPKKRSIYSEKWSENVVLEFLETYGRATKYFAKKAGIEYFSLCRLLEKYVRGSQIKWETIKKTIKDINKGWEPPPNFVEYLTYAKDIEALKQLEGYYDEDRAQLLLDIAKLFDYSDIRTR